MARTIITTQTLFFVLVLFVLAIFFYNVMHFSTGLKSTKYELKIQHQKEEIKKLNARVLELESEPRGCGSDSESEVEDDEANDGKRPINGGSTTTTTTKTTPTKTAISRASDSETIPVLVMACDRADYLEETLKRLFEYKPKKNFPVIVSQGCGDVEVANLLRDKYRNQLVAIQHQKDHSVLPYFAIAQHYGWALAQVFSVMNYDSVIVVEDDLVVSPDFFSYFLSLYPIIKADPSLYCISSWNDNGMREVVKNNSAIYRTEVFPGLGWMMLKSLWNEIVDKWPDRYWDEFMRLPEIRKERSCLFPEISRNKNIGRIGASDGQFWDKISRIKFNEDNVNFNTMDMSYLIKEQYNSELRNKIARAKVTTIGELSRQGEDDQSEEDENRGLRINYRDFPEYQNIARYFQIMDDEKHGMPRTSYRGIVQFYHDNKHVFLVPQDINTRW